MNLIAYPKKIVCYERLQERIVAAGGEEEFAHHIAVRLAEGESLRGIADGFGVPGYILLGWVEEHCAELVALAGRARADDLESEATKVVRSADVDSVQVDKLKSGHFMEIAGKLNAGKWGAGKVGGVGVGITVVVNRGGVLQVGGVVEEKGVVIEGSEVI